MCQICKSHQIHEQRAAGKETDRDCSQLGKTFFNRFDERFLFSWVNAATCKEESTRSSTSSVRGNQHIRHRSRDIPGRLSSELRYECNRCSWVSDMGLDWIWVFEQL
mmetsp:Transcript_25572/g.100975  ORF Transcript_25572/g.100975 Transcript_25572/m.100975 type:complete len:107 (-) Transcript_25572:272-592(-)